MKRNKKILYISSMVSSSFSGGSQCSIRNLDSIKEIFGSENVVCYLLTPFSFKKSTPLKTIKRIWDSMCLRPTGVTKNIEKDILLTITDKDISRVFLDSSLNGRLIKYLKTKSCVQVISFFHNCEYSLALQHFRTGAFWILPRLFSAFFGEKLTCKYSDKIISLNERDSRMINKLYRRMPDYIIPISLKKSTCELSAIYNDSFNICLLFVGSNFYPNIHGIKWFVKKVLPHIDAKLLIVGKNMDKLNTLTSEKIEIYCNVPSLVPFYERADLVIAPIFKGAGMKVKTAESLMYGKPIIGTSEAFQGYRVVEGMFEANDSQSFIEQINRFQKKRKEFDLRNHFLNYYSFEATLSLFKRCFEL